MRKITNFVLLYFTTWNFKYEWVACILDRGIDLLQQVLVKIISTIHTFQIFFEILKTKRHTSAKRQYLLSNQNPFKQFWIGTFFSIRVFCSSWRRKRVFWCFKGFLPGPYPLFITAIRIFFFITKIKKNK